MTVALAPATSLAQLAVDRQGHGPAVVLLHGIGGGRVIWGAEGSGTLQALAQAGFEALAFDLPGYGASPLPVDGQGEPRLTLASMAQAVADALDAAGIDRAWVVGHSMGGMVAQELAWAHPQRVAGLVLACTSPAFGQADGAWQQAFLRDRLAPLDAGQGMAAVAARLVPAMVAPGIGEAAQARSAAVMARVPEATYRAALRALMDFDRREALAALRGPVLCLAAEHDRTAPVAVMQKMAQRIAGAEFACVPAAGHIVNVEQPAAFHEALLGFLNRAAPGAAP
jgi:3-oxoadipate enol-lactonase